MAKRMLDFKVGTVVSLIARPEIMMKIDHETKSHWFLRPMTEDAKEWLNKITKNSDDWVARYKSNTIAREGLRQRKLRFKRTWKYSIPGSVLFGGNIADRKQI